MSKRKKQKEARANRKNNLAIQRALAKGQHERISDDGKGNLSLIDTVTSSSTSPSHHTTTHRAPADSGLEYVSGAYYTTVHSAVGRVFKFAEHVRTALAWEQMPADEKMYGRGIPASANNSHLTDAAYYILEFKDFRSAPEPVQKAIGALVSRLAKTDDKATAIRYVDNASSYLSALAGAYQSATQGKKVLQSTLENNVTAFIEGLDERLAKEPVKVRRVAKPKPTYADVACFISDNSGYVVIVGENLGNLVSQLPDGELTSQTNASGLDLVMVSATRDKVRQQLTRAGYQIAGAESARRILGDQIYHDSLRHQGDRRKIVKFAQSQIKT